MNQLKFSVFFFLVVFLIAPGFSLAEEILDKVAAVVNDEVITQSELDQLLMPVYQKYKSKFSGETLMVKMNEARQKLLSQLIEDRLVYQESKRLGVQVTSEEVNARYEESKARFPSGEKFEKLLAQQGLTVSKLKERYREQIAIQKLHQHEIRSKIIVTPKDIEDYYASHSGKFTQKETVRARTITIRKSEEAVKKKEEDPVAKAKAEGILKRFYAGEDFATVAKQFSEDTMAAEGGNLGNVARGDLVRNLDEVLFNLKHGEISPVLETPMGYHIFKVEKKKARRTKPLDEVRDKISGLLFRKKSRQRFKEWMEDLKKNAYITIR